jgi:large subunit ribosomal protein L10
MAITKAKKGEALENLRGILKDSLSVVFVNFHGLTSNDVNEVRATLKKEKTGYFVTKKTLARKALEEAKVEGSRPEFPGELGIVYGPDAIAPARGVYAFQKKLEDKISIVGGIFEGKFVNKSEMEAIALIPPVQTLQGMFVNIINSPIQRMVIALNEVAKKKSV